VRPWEQGTRPICLRFQKECKTYICALKDFLLTYLSKVVPELSRHLGGAWQLWVLRLARVHVRGLLQLRAHTAKLVVARIVRGRVEGARGLHIALRSDILKGGA
jgi:hypothetical protein